MATLRINNYTILTYESDVHQQIYWKKMTNFIIEKYGDRRFDDYNEVNNILNDCFNFLLDEFSSIISPIDKVSFYRYCFFLHEESLKLLIDSRSGFNLNEHINEADFSRYRRILKLILEQGCEKVLKKSSKPDDITFQIFDIIIQKLYYLGTWLYSIADHIAYHRMLNGCKTIYFEDEDLIVEWKNNFGKLYSHLFENSYIDYEKATSDENLTLELIEAINKNYKIDFNFACGMIFEIQKHHSKSIFQTIEPYILPINLSSVPNINIDLETAKQFYDGLIISKKNKMTIADCILKPYSTQRYLFRPLLVYNIEGVERMFVSKNKFAESIYVIASNAISWNTLSEDWLKNKEMQKFISRKGNEHDKILEDKIEIELRKNHLKFARNIKSLKTLTNNNINIDNAQCGEVDFIIIDEEHRRVIVADSKYNKAKYEGVGYRSDYSNFTKYEIQIEKKLTFVRQNIELVQTHFRRIYNSNEIEINDFDVVGAFFINTPTFYMYNSVYSVVTLNKIQNFISEGVFNPEIEINYEGELYRYSYPYFTV